MKSLKHAEFFAYPTDPGYANTRVDGEFNEIVVKTSNWARAYEVRVRPSEDYYGLELEIHYGEVHPDSSKEGSGTPVMKRIAVFKNADQLELVR